MPTRFRNFTSATRKPFLIQFGLYQAGQQADLDVIEGISDASVPITGAQNGANPTFTIPYSPYEVQIFRRGLLMKPLLDYTFSGSTITWLNPDDLPNSDNDPTDTFQIFPVAGDYSTGVYYPTPYSVSGPHIPAGTIDGVNDTFTLAVTPITLWVYLRGLWVGPGIGYTLVGSTLTMAAGYIPGAGDAFFYYYYGA